MEDDIVDLPPGFRFHPTDEEIITHYLTKKVLNPNFSACAIGEADLNKCEPWDLPRKAHMGEKERYFFNQKDRKYPTGMRTNRATESGYWKATGKDKEIYRGKNTLVGMKKTLVFYKGRAPKGEKTNWVLHEYRLEGKFSYYNLPKASKDEWVVSRIFHKSTGIKKIMTSPMSGLFPIDPSGEDELLDPSSSSLPPLMDDSYFSRPSASFANSENGFPGMTSASVPRSADGNYADEFNRLQRINPSNTNYQMDPSGSAFSTMLSGQAPVPIPSFQGPANPDYFFGFGYGGGNDNQAIIRGMAASQHETPGLDKMMLIKGEQFSASNNRSMVSLSQDMGLSTDANAEISSSAVSKQEVGNFSDYLEYTWE